MLIGDDVVSSAVMKQIDNLYPRLAVLDDYQTQSCYAFVVSRLFRELAAIAEPDGCIEVYKIDYQLMTGLPTFYLISSRAVNDVALETLFDDFERMIKQVSVGELLGRK
ncbi:hypothetical protein [Aliagarivorans taiwanensis]|uniref:hypothetical protein n=1 Tax=Aliagarivorans taiwanensis TaxID=561966 RepID=UPI00047B7229|nr:hypothetical protein [Aliagarivorans taiwanensis]